MKKEERERERGTLGLFSEEGQRRPSSFFSFFSLLRMPLLLLRGQQILLGAHHSKLQRLEAPTEGVPAPALVAVLELRACAEHKNRQEQQTKQDHTPKRSVRGQEREREREREGEK